MTLTDIKFPNTAFINGGAYTPPYTDTLQITSPIDKRHLTTLPDLRSEDVDYAVNVAKTAFDKGTWRKLSKREKQKILYTFADLIDQQASHIATLESWDMGMPFGMCQNQNVAHAAQCIRWYAEAIDKIYDETTHDNGKMALVTREPVGVVGVITPWNFPVMIVAWKIAPALIMGNSIVLKPAETASLATVYLAQLATQAGVPDGVFNVVTGSGHITGKAIAQHPLVRVLSFTGSGGVGAQLMQDAGTSNLKRVYLELGGKNANIVLPDVPDMDVAVGTSVMGAFANSGQICASPSRLLVHADIYDVFVEKCIAKAKQLQVGNPFDQGIFLGPVANRQQYEKILSYIHMGKQQGATCVIGGTPPTEMEGYYIHPTIFTDVTPDMIIAQQEIFGPVLSVIKFNDTDEAIAIANACEYGLTAGVWTANIRTAHYVSSRLESGTVFVNHFGGADITLPFGGVKQSGNGVDKSLHAIDKYCNLKSTIFAL